MSFVDEKRIDCTKISFSETVRGPLQRSQERKIRTKENTLFSLIFIENTYLKYVIEYLRFIVCLIYRLI